MIWPRSYRKFTNEFRESALRGLSPTSNVSEMCRELGISRQLFISGATAVSARRASSAKAPGERAVEAGAGAQDARPLAIAA